MSPGRLAGAALLVAAGCAFPTGGAVDVPDLRGDWAFTAQQAAPPRTLVGTLAITAQDGGLVGGTVEWQEADGLGGVVLGGGALTGEVIGQADVDFDVATSVGTRRFVGARVADTISGTWLQLSAGGPSGTFRLERQDP